MHKNSRSRRVLSGSTPRLDENVLSVGHFLAHKPRSIAIIRFRCRRVAQYTIAPAFLDGWLPPVVSQPILEWNDSPSYRSISRHSIIGIGQCRREVRPATMLGRSCRFVRQPNTERSGSPRQKREQLHGLVGSSKDAIDHNRKFFKGNPSTQIAGLHLQYLSHVEFDTHSVRLRSVPTNTPRFPHFAGK